MKRYWPVIGAVGLAATAGLYFSLDCNTLYQEPETEEFLEEKKKYESRYKAELPKTPVHYTLETNSKKEQISNKQDTPKHNKNERENEKSKQKVLLPKPSSEETVAEDAREFPSYYIPPAERDFELYRAQKYFNEALEAKDYKIAETYIEDILMEDILKQSDHPESTKKDLLCQIAVSYLNYLIAVSNSCAAQDQYSVLRKVISMNAILDKYKEEISCQTTTIKTDNGTDLILYNQENNKDNKEKNLYDPEKVHSFKKRGDQDITIVEANYLQTEGEKTLQKILNCHE